MRNKCVNEGSFAFSYPDLSIELFFSLVIDPVHSNRIIMVVYKTVFDLIKRRGTQCCVRINISCIRSSLQPQVSNHSPLHTNRSWQISVLIFLQLAHHPHLDPLFLLQSTDGEGDVPQPHVVCPSQDKLPNNLC